MDAFISTSYTRGAERSEPPLNLFSSLPPGLEGFNSCPAFGKVFPASAAFDAPNCAVGHAKLGSYLSMCALGIANSMNIDIS